MKLGQSDFVGPPDFLAPLPPPATVTDYGPFFGDQTGGAVAPAVASPSVWEAIGSWLNPAAKIVYDVSQAVQAYRGGALPGAPALTHAATAAALAQQNAARAAAAAAKSPLSGVPPALFWGGAAVLALVLLSRKR